jgi:hypothetical protein
MVRIMPSQVVQTIDELFPHAINPSSRGMLLAQHSSRLLGILNLVRSIPEELITLNPADYADLVLAESTIEEHMALWRNRDGEMAHVKGSDAVTVIRRVLARCPDEYPPSTTTELVFVKDVELRDSIRRDIGAANRALNNAEWKAATVLAGASIEALLHWRLQEPAPGPTVVKSAVAALVSNGTMGDPTTILIAGSCTISSRSLAT